MYVKKFTSFCQVLKRCTPTKENRFLFSAYVFAYVLWWMRELRPRSVEERSIAINVSVSLSVYFHIWGITIQTLSDVRRIYLLLWLGPPLVALRYFMYFRFCGFRHVIGQASTQSDVAGASWIWYRGVLLNWLTRGQHRTGGGVCCLRWSGHCYGCVRRSARCLTATWTRTRWNTPTWMTQSSPGTSSFTRSAGIVIPAWGSRSSAVRVSRPNNNNNNTSSVVMMLWWRSKSLR